MRRNSLAMGKSTPIDRFYGIGEKRAEAFHRLGIFTARDLVYHFPRAYEPRGNVRTTAEAEDGEVCSLIMTVAIEPKTAMIRKGMTLTKFTAVDDEGMCSVTFFNQPYVKDMAHKGMVFRFFGKVRRDGFAVSMTSPIMEPVVPSRPLRALVPIYPLTAGISQKLIGGAVRDALEAIRSETDGLDDPLPERLRQKYGLLPIRDALSLIHLPRTLDDTALAVRRLAFDELYLFALAMMLSKDGETRTTDAPLEMHDKTEFLARQPFTMTGAQLRALEAIEKDLTGGGVMNRLVVGDVGSGKTAVAAYAVWLTLKNGRQAAWMAPTEILARQHYAELSAFFDALGYRTELIVGSMKASEKRRALDRLALGVSHFAIGTHALIEETVTFNELSLAVIDEQHRFGTAQRRKLTEKARDVHLLCMSATPIPRTLAMVVYCDTDVSIIDEMPPGRKKVDTFLVSESYRDRLNAFIRKNVSAGGQVYIVCPAVEEEESLESESGDKLSAADLIPLMGDREEKPKKKAAVAFAEELSTRVFPDLRVAFVHGKMNGKDKDRIMGAFAAGEVDILVSTTVIEVGVNVPRATLMIVENAEQFGLSALHQLRGRVGRGADKSYCVLVSDSRVPRSRERMNILCKSNDGFFIAQKDLEMRGPGDFLEQIGGKTRQSGDFDLGVASLEKDVKLLYTAFDEARATLEADPTLASAENQPLRAEIFRKGRYHPTQAPTASNNTEV